MSAWSTRGQQGISWAPTSAREWLAWRDDQALGLETFAPHIASAMVTGAAMRHEADMKLIFVSEVAKIFRTAELVVWEEEQWTQVRDAASAFTSAPMRPLGTESQVWTWPTDRLVKPEQRAQWDLPPHFQLSALIIMPMPELLPDRLAQVREKIAAAKAATSGSPFYHIVEEAIGVAAASDVMVAGYFAPHFDDAAALQEARIRLQRGDPSELTPRLYVLRHSRDTLCTPEWALVSAASAFMAERIFEKQAMPQSRQMRRAYERDHPGRSSSVQVVVLRRSSSSPAAHGEKAAPAQYRCRWWVGGHWRRRCEKWQRSDGPIYVRPHIKGPEDKPLKPRENRVVRVSR